MRCRFSLFITLLLLAGASLAQAQVLLKPVGGIAMPLRLKSVTADVRIDGQFASTTVQLVFYNESEHSREAEFKCSLPPMSTATYFAYWAEDEKVVARVVPKEKAAEIYGTITSWNRDPALVEMTGRNTFSARVFPIFVGEDLKIEVRYVQVLPSDHGDIVYTLPFMEPDLDADDVKLETVHIGLRIKASPEIGEIENNYGLQMASTAEDHELTLDAANFRPPKDLVVRMRRAPKPLLVSTYAARSGGSDGFFALALTPDHSLTSAKATVCSVSTYQVITPSTVKAGEVMLVTGRYRGSGNATVTLTGQSPIGRLSYTGSVRLDGSTDADNIAAKLWAGARIDQLSESDGNERAVTDLSTQFGIPSKYTSWLAVPKAEMEMYNQEHEREKDRLQLERDLWSLANMIADGKGSTARARKLRARVAPMAKGTGWEDAHSMIKAEVQNVGWSAAAELAKAISEGDPRKSVLAALRKRVAGAARAVGAKSREWLASGAEDVAYDVGRELAQVELADRPDVKQSAALRNKLARLRSAYGKSVDDEAGDARKWLAREGLRELAEQVANEQVKEYPDTARVEKLERKMAQLEKACPGESYREWIQWAMGTCSWKYDTWLFAEIKRLRGELLQEFARSPRDEGKIKQLGDRFVELNARYKGEDYGRSRLKALETKVRLEAIQQDMAASEQGGDTTAVAGLRTAAQDAEKQIKELCARMGDPLISVEVPADAQRVLAILPDGEIKVLEHNAASGKWEGRFDIPLYASEGRYSIKIMIILADGTRKSLTMGYSVDLTAPSGKARVIGGKTAISLTLDTDDDTARAVALLPWGERVELARSASTPDRFVGSAEVPDNRGGEVQIEFVLTDRAHNRSSIRASLAR